MRESASEAVKRTRTRVRTIEGRIRGILKVGGEGAPSMCMLIAQAEARHTAPNTLLALLSLVCCWMVAALCRRGTTAKSLSRRGACVWQCPPPLKAPPRASCLGRAPLAAPGELRKSSGAPVCGQGSQACWRGFG